MKRPARRCIRSFVKLLVCTDSERKKNCLNILRSLIAALREEKVQMLSECNNWYECRHYMSPTRQHQHNQLVS